MAKGMTNSGAHRIIAAILVNIFPHPFLGAACAKPSFAHSPASSSNRNRPRRGYHTIAMNDHVTVLQHEATVMYL